MRPLSSAWLRRALVACAFACAVASSALNATGASSTVVVSADVPSASSLTNSCTAASATRFGSVLPGSASRTATGAGVCRVTFGSSNDSSMLRINQADGTGNAMTAGLEPPTVISQSGLPGRIYGTFAYDGTLAYSAGRAGTLFRTMNSGSNWLETAVPGGPSLNDVEAVPGTPDTWWVVGNTRQLHKSVDAQVGSPTWTSQNALLSAAGWPAAVDVEAITIPDVNTIVVVGASRWIAKSTNGGASFTAFQHTDTTIGRITGVDAVDANTMVAVTDTGKILRTTTGGGSSAAWTVSTAPGSTRALYDVATDASNRAFAVGALGYVVTWDGTSWTDRSANAGVAGDIYGVDVRPGSPDTATAIDERGNVWTTTDVGATWARRETGSSERYGDVSYGTANFLAAGGSSRAVLASTDAGVTWTGTNILANGTLNTIAASPSSGQYLVAVGTKGYVRRSTNGGASWTTGTSGTSQAIMGVSLASNTTGWAVGTNGTILRTTDTGSTWTAQTAPAGVGSERLIAVVAIDTANAIAVGSGGTIIATTNGGSVWQARSSGVTRPLTSISMNDDGSTIIATGSQGTILRSTNQGVTWTATPGGSMPSATANVIGVDFASASTAYATTGTSAVWKTTDGGATWTATAGAAGASPRAIGALGDTVALAGLDDVSSRSNDQGVTFNSSVGSTLMHQRSVIVVDAHVAYSVGADATIYRFDPDPAATKQVGDWSGGTRDWTNGSFFGVCLQAVGGAASADWTLDTFNTAGTCEQLNTDPWRAVPTASDKAAHTNAAGLGNVDLVWGFRADQTLAAADYSATIAFETIAPNA